MNDGQWARWAIDTTSHLPSNFVEDDFPVEAEFPGFHVTYTLRLWLKMAQDGSRYSMISQTNIAMVLHLLEP